jgi:hypothetical protein
LHRDRVDAILTDPPFGGEEERGILFNFPEDRQTAETLLQFFQVITRKPRRPVGGDKGGRCGMVVPNGVLSGDGDRARIKEELLKETARRFTRDNFCACICCPDTLLAAKGDQRIDAQGSPGRPQRSEADRTKEQKHRADVGDRIDGAHAIQLPP